MEMSAELHVEPGLPILPFRVISVFRGHLSSTAMPSFTHDRIEFFYQDTLRGVPFVFQHGLGGDVTQPFGLFRPPAWVRLIAFDARGHGRTEPLGEPEKLCFDVFATDLLALLEHLKIERAIVGGISMGAALALNFTLHFPARVLGLVLSRPAWLDAPHPWNVHIFTLVSQLMREHGREQGRALFLQTPEYRDALRQWPDVANSLASQFENPRAEISATKLERIIHDTPSRDRREWSAIRVPTLVLANRLDPIHPFEFGEELARRIPGAEFHEITAKSVSVERHGADVQARLESFLEAHFAPAPPAA